MKKQNLNEQLSRIKGMMKKVNEGSFLDYEFDADDDDDYGMKPEDVEIGGIYSDKGDTCKVLKMYRRLEDVVKDEKFNTLKDPEGIGLMPALHAILDEISEGRGNWPIFLIKKHDGDYNFTFASELKDKDEAYVSTRDDDDDLYMNEDVSTNGEVEESLNEPYFASHGNQHWVGASGRNYGNELNFDDLGDFDDDTDFIDYDDLNKRYPDSGEKLYGASGIHGYEAMNKNFGPLVIRKRRKPDYDIPGFEGTMDSLNNLSIRD